MNKFDYEVRFHVADNNVCGKHWDTMTVEADCISNARYNAIMRIKSEFDYDVTDVDVLEIYTSSGELVKAETF